MIAEAGVVDQEIDWLVRKQSSEARRLLKICEVNVANLEAQRWIFRLQFHA
jgi:hypothetical protein